MNEAEEVQLHLKVLEQKPLTADELRAFLGAEEDDEMEARIPTCAGAWVRRDDGLYGFDQDPDWEE